MSGLQTNLNKQKKEIIAATALPPENGDYVWNGKDEDDRPLNKQEMRKGIKNSGGRPILANPKKSTTIRLNAEVLDFFKSQGKGWQTKINDILQKYVNSHHAA
jgi:uncharacterized protein (DUF4415 family)